VTVAFLSEWIEPGGLDDAIAEILPGFVAELQDQARAQGGRLDMGAAVRAVFAQGFLTGFHLGRHADASQ
jgi:hypothetical protein